MESKTAATGETVRAPRDSGGSIAPDVSRPGIRILVADDDPSVLESCESILSEHDYEVDVFRKPDEAIRELRRQRHHILLTDQRMPEMDGLELIAAQREHAPGMLSIVMTGYATTEASVQALRAGAWDYLPKPFTATQLLVLIGRAVHRLEQERSVADRAREEGVIASDGVQILGTSSRMVATIEKARKVARTDASVFIVGESGTGKELVARFIHANSRRRDEPFVPVNCAALPGELLESEMFGHRKGAFTGAVRDKPGLLETADGGTFFLDELCEMPVQLQPKLLRVLQDGRIRRVGSESEDASVDVRFVSATNRDPEEALEAGDLRQDLYYRLRVVPLHLPPLRNRPEDIPLLVRHYLGHYWRRHELPGDAPPEMSSDAMERMLEYDWPGNVRELENLVEQAVVLSEPGEPITADALPLYEGDVPSGDGAGPSGASGDEPLSGLDFGRPYHEAKEDLVGWFERRYLASVITRAEGNMSEAARLAEIDRTTLYRLLEKHDLSKQQLEG
ncbi:MAG: sigma-54 dependent transcriptional regulator [Gemmatimonadota bacterium]|nr:sigma-54 dependent transcriptional regulator [Gemmatimonadota bacterium]